MATPHAAKPEERNRQLIRQWRILASLETSRTGRTLQALATEHGVCIRTIRRDLEALQAAGFPLVDDNDVHDLAGCRVGNRWRALDWRKAAA